MDNMDLCIDRSIYLQIHIVHRSCESYPYQLWCLCYFQSFPVEPTGGNDTAMGMLCCPGPKEFPQAGASEYSRFQSKCSLNELCITVLIPEQI